MKILPKITLIAVFVSALGLGGLTRATYASELPYRQVTPQPQRSNELGESDSPNDRDSGGRSVADSTQRLNLPTQQSILSRLNLSSDQEAQLQQIKQPSTVQDIQPILSSGQNQMWLQMQRADFGGR